jgi:hypothetical protein
MNDYYLEKSNRKNKKYMVSWISPETGKVRTIHFGDNRYTDFILSKGNEELKKRYMARHHKEDWDDLEGAASWAKNILWGEKTLKKSIKKMEDKFNIKIHLIQ